VDDAKLSLLIGMGFADAEENSRWVWHGGYGTVGGRGVGAILQDGRGRGQGLALPTPPRTHAVAALLVHLSGVACVRCTPGRSLLYRLLWH